MVTHLVCLILWQLPVSRTKLFPCQSSTNPTTLRVPLEEIIARIDATDLEAAASSSDIKAVPLALGNALAELSDDPFDMPYWIDPLACCRGLDTESLNNVIKDAMARDITEAIAGHDSASKAGLWVISAGRKPTAIALENGRGDASDRTVLSQYMAFGQMVGSGPPLFRTRELLALADAGLVTFLGPSPTLIIDDGFTIRSDARTASADTLADAFLPGPDIRNTNDTLVNSLLQAQRIRPFTPEAGSPTASPETDGATRRTVHPDGSLDTRLHIVGIPTGKQWADVTISPMPGTDPLMLQETDNTAQSLLRAATAQPPA